jgi:hypothetical protein
MLAKLPQRRGGIGFPNVPPVATALEARVQYPFLIGRVLFGGYFALNGFRNLTRMSDLAPVLASKGLPAAPLAIVVSGLMILAGGLAVALGRWVAPGTTRPSSRRTSRYSVRQSCSA